MRLILLAPGLALALAAARSAEAAPQDDASVNAIYSAMSAGDWAAVDAGLPGLRAAALAEPRHDRSGMCYVYICLRYRTWRPAEVEGELGFYRELYEIATNVGHGCAGAAALLGGKMEPAEREAFWVEVLPGLLEEEEAAALFLETAQLARARGALTLMPQRIAAARESMERCAAVRPAQHAARYPFLPVQLECVESEYHRAIGRLLRAAANLDAARAALSPGAPPTVRADLLLQEARLAVARADPEGLSYVVEELRDDEELIADPLTRAYLASIEALMSASMSRADPAQLELALERLTSSSGDAALPKTQRRTMKVALAHALLRAGRIARAREVIEDLEQDPGRLVLRLPLLRRRLARLEEDGSPVSAEEVFESYGEFLDSWRAHPRPVGGVGFLHFASQRNLVSDVLEACLEEQPGSDGVARALFELLRAHEVAASALARGGALTGDGRTPAQVLALLRSHLADGEGVAILLPAPERGHLFLLDDTGLQHVPLPSGGVLGGASRRFATELGRFPAVGTPSERFPFAEGRALTDLVLPERARTWLAARARLTAIGFDLVDGLALELLPLGGDVLGRVVAVTHLGSLAQLVNIPPVRDEYAPKITCLAAPRVDPKVASRYGLVPLPVAPARRPPLVPGSVEGVVRTGERASASAWLEALTSSRVVEFVGHGVRDFARAYTTGIALAPPGGEGGLVFAEHLTQGALPDLVVLLSCGTGGGSRIAGDDTRTDLVGAMLAGGAGTVIAASGEMEYLSALLLLRAVNRALLAGESPAEAARLARSELAADPARCHPSFGWIEVHGLGHRPVLERD